MANLGRGICAVNPDVGAVYILGGIRQQEGNRSHEIFGLAHLALGNERNPLLLEIGVLVENLFRPVGKRMDCQSLLPILLGEEREA